jgi:citronellyl-CoA dehydrogenase
MTAACFGPEHEVFRATARQFIVTELQPRTERWERTGAFPRRVLAACAQHGLLTTDALRSAVVAEEMPRCESAGLALTVFVQTTLVAPLLDRLGTDDQKRQVLAPLLNGKTLAAMAVTEPGAGSDVGQLSCSAEERRQTFVLNGVKTYITNAAHADVLVVGALTGHTPMPEASLLLVPATTPGVRVERLRTLGLETSAMGRITFKNARVPRSGLLGERGAGFSYIQDALNRERLFGGLATVAWAQLICQRTAAFAKRRRAFGRPIARFQAIRHHFAEMATSLEAARQLNYATLTRWLAGDDMTKEICMIKLFSYDAAQRTVERCLQIHGGIGYLDDHWISRAYRDARALTIAAGTPEVMKDMIAAYLRI